MNPALPELLEALTHLRFAHGLNDDCRTTDTIADIIDKVAALIDNENKKAESNEQATRNS